MSEDHLVHLVDDDDAIRRSVSRDRVAPRNGGLGGFSRQEGRYGQRREHAERAKHCDP